MFTLHKIDQKGLAQLASQLACNLSVGDIITLSGNIGAGKTTLTRMIIQTLDPNAKVVSPTFNLLHIYPTKIGKIWHFDLYRSPSLESIINTGILDALKDVITIIEWSEKSETLLPPEKKLSTTMEYNQDPNYRNLVLELGTLWKEKKNLVNHLMSY